MKKLLQISLIMLILMNSLVACENKKADQNQDQTGTIQNDLIEADVDEIQQLVLVAGADSGDLLLASRDESNVSGVYSLKVQPEDKISIDEKEAIAADLKNGMYISLKYAGGIKESFPAEFSQIVALEAKMAPLEEYPDICGFYLQVLTDLWNKDKALNGKVVGFDLTQVPGNLSQSQKSAIVYLFGATHQVEVVHGTQAELIEQGYITKTAGDESADIYWEDGCLLSIQSSREGENIEGSEVGLYFDAEKWSSGTGAYFFLDCRVEWLEPGTWSEYTIGTEAIS